MKRNFIKFTGIALVSTLAFTACHKEAVKEEPFLAALLAQAVKSAASGNCAISINLSGLYYGAALQGAIGSQTAAAFGGNDYDTAVGGNAFRTHYNAINGTALAANGLATEPYNKKYDTFFTDSATWTSTVRAAYLRTYTTTVNANLPQVRGTGILVCARIPRASCSFDGLTTANRSTDIANQTTVVNSVLSNLECKKTPAITQQLKTNSFFGLPTTLPVTSLNDGSTFVPPSNGSAVSNATNQVILAEKSYPKFGTLVSLGFGALMPMKTGATAFELTSTNYTAGSNINVAQIDSCETIGFTNDRGATPHGGTLALTSPQEIAYSFSTQGLSAAAYASARSVTTIDGTAASLDAAACNSSFRSKFSIPLALGGGKLPVINGVSGDGGATSLITSCVYGGTLATRSTTNATLIALSSVLTGLTQCPAAASTAAAKFGDDGLQTLADFPNN